mmetsp:Transcript_149329/g.271411  ORF Transcript_149329/g.271411 Transcript_149329/m.271411 type:complete len:174 (+) Transcript_149329:1499-2020(+)
MLTMLHTMSHRAKPVQKPSSLAQFMTVCARTTELASISMAMSCSALRAFWNFGHASMAIDNAPINAAQQPKYPLPVSVKGLMNVITAVPHIQRMDKKTAMVFLVATDIFMSSSKKRSRQPNSQKSACRSHQSKCVGVIDVEYDTLHQHHKSSKTQCEEKSCNNCHGNVVLRLK